MSGSLGIFCRRMLPALALVLLLVRGTPAQESAPATKPAQQQTSPAESGQKSHQAKPESEDQDQAAPPPNPATKITSEQAQQLFHEVDTILDFASKDSDLPIKHGVKRRLISREEVVAYLKKNMAEDKDVQRLRRTELVLKKFGLLPKDFDLQTFLVSLL